MIPASQQQNAVIRRKTEFRGLSEADTLAQTGPDVAAATLRGFVPISQTWADENGVKVLSVIYEQRGPDRSGWYHACPNCGFRRMFGMYITSTCPTCGYRMAPPAPPADPPKSKGGSSALATALMAVVLVVGTLWFLNSTRVGVEIKCRYLNDPGACLELLVLQ